MSRRSRRRSTGQKPDPAPVLLPHALVSVSEAGTLDVTVDGAPYPPPQEAEPWTREEFGDVLDAITQDRTVPVRVEVHESDGTVFTDLLRPHIRPQTHATSPAPETPPPVRRGRHAKDKLRPAPVQVTADGFEPGEDVVVAVILTRTRATDDDNTDGTGTGTARALLDFGQLQSLTDGGVEVVLHGRASGVTQVRRLS
ncbi:MAG: hypothetical protein L0H31_14785 [Nocardioidaceae bacterium]|nr:hypothetical protein [Nocardioidaceae bacterium]